MSLAHCEIMEALINNTVSDIEVVCSEKCCRHPQTIFSCIHTIKHLANVPYLKMPYDISSPSFAKVVNCISPRF